MDPKESLAFKSQNYSVSWAMREASYLLLPPRKVLGQKRGVTDMSEHVGGACLLYTSMITPVIWKNWHCLKTM